MRHRFSLVAAGAVRLAACSAPAPVPSSAEPNDDAAVGRVTAGLRSQLTVKGAPAITYTLAERMAHHKVPGVSIAVVDLSLIHI